MLVHLATSCVLRHEYVYQVESWRGEACQQFGWFLLAVMVSGGKGGGKDDVGSIEGGSQVCGRE